MLIVFSITPFGWDEVMAVVKQAVDVVAAQAPRVDFVLKVDICPGVNSALTSKAAAVDELLDGA